MTSYFSDNLIIFFLFAGFFAALKLQLAYAPTVSL